MRQRFKVVVIVAFVVAFVVVVVAFVVVVVVVDVNVIYLDMSIHRTNFVSSQKNAQVSESWSQYNLSNLKKD